MLFRSRPIGHRSRKIPSAPTLRPADILTSATSQGRAAALDVGITSPEASAAGVDCTASMVARKTSNYAPYAHELRRQNVDYKPIVWSAYGRPHGDATKFITQLCRKLARRRGFTSAAVLQRRLECGIATEIWRRAARMVAACLPLIDEIA